jgi:hypothetical protein
MLLSWLSYRPDPELRKSIVTLSLWVRILFVGPAAIQIAMHASFRGLRLQAYGFPKP